MNWIDKKMLALFLFLGKYFYDGMITCITDENIISLLFYRQDYTDEINEGNYDTVMWKRK